MKKRPVLRGFSGCFPVWGTKRAACEKSHRQRAIPATEVSTARDGDSPPHTIMRPQSAPVSNMVRAVYCRPVHAAVAASYMHSLTKKVMGDHRHRMALGVDPYRITRQSGLRGAPLAWL